MTTVSPHTVISSFMPANKIIKKVKKKKIVKILISYFNY